MPWASEMRTSLKLAGGAATLALLVHWASRHEVPTAQAVARPLTAAAPNAAAPEPAQSISSGETRSTAVLVPKNKEPPEDSPCTAGCFEQEAGYNWAEQMRVDDPVDCDNESSSFVEGCLAYAETQQAEVDDSWEDR